MHGPINSLVCFLRCMCYAGSPCGTLKCALLTAIAMPNRSTNFILFVNTHSTMPSARCMVWNGIFVFMHTPGDLGTTFLGGSSRVSHVGDGNGVAECFLLHPLPTAPIPTPLIPLPFPHIPLPIPEPSPSFGISPTPSFWISPAPLFLNFTHPLFMNFAYPLFLDFTCPLFLNFTHPIFMNFAYPLFLDFTCPSF